MFSKRHYEAIAHVINCRILTKHYNAEQRTAIRSVADNLSDMFKDDNPRFNQKKFEDACTAGLKLAGEPSDKGTPDA